MALAGTRIAIGGVVRNRGWILPEYLSHLEEIEYDDKEYLFLENDSEDDTRELLADFANKRERTTILFHNTGHQQWDRGTRSVDRYQNLADIRNKFIEAALHTGADYLLSVDSDILVPPDIAGRLLASAENGKAIVAAAVSNVPDKPLDGTTAGNFLVEQSNMIVHPDRYPLTGVHEMACVGAVYLIPREVLASGVRYGPHAQGEDVPFCNQARRMGYRLKVDIGLVCEHRMTKG